MKIIYNNYKQHRGATLLAAQWVFQYFSAYRCLSIEKILVGIPQQEAIVCDEEALNNILTHHISTPKWPLGSRKAVPVPGNLLLKRKELPGAKGSLLGARLCIPGAKDGQTLLWSLRSLSNCPPRTL
ncbi:hypothetical protein JTE90_025848 [Oedothorax gibbosus]|uniref:Uncharacterized protein n=1 Tax=Oedothorax gibbosus TaxID=931172 RepID=A0AAV6UN93_9ARAC|nr:hypothetical protein JTE90_025848 [Oedothorax gibbosus]